MTSDKNTPQPPEGHRAGEAENAIELRAVEGKSQGQIVRERFFNHRGAIIGLVALVVIALLALSSIGFPVFGWYVGGWWSWNPAETPALVNPGGAPTLTMPWSDAGFAIGSHPFGQDTLGRDIFARTMKGVQTSLVIMVVVGVVVTVVGVLIGALSGFYRGWTDTGLMRLTDLFITMPTLVVGAVLGKLVGSASALPLALALGFISWTTIARLVRGDFLSLREREFVDAARVAGASDSRIIFKHILPNAMGVIIVSVTLMMSAAILLETALSYLGFGIQAPTVSLGKMISDYQSSFSTRPWLFWWPGLFIITVVLSVNFIGDGLRDAFDPRQKKLPSARSMKRADRLAQRSAGASAS